jgi:hypothetical protein
MPGRRSAGLAAAWVQPEIANETVSGPEALDIADPRHHRGRGSDTNPRNRHQPTDLLGADCLLGQRTVDQVDLSAQEVELTQTRCRSTREPRDPQEQGCGRRAPAARGRS